MVDLTNKTNQGEHEMTKETRTAATVSEGIRNMIETMQEDFRKAYEQTVEFCEGFEVNTGRKYAKVISGNSVTAFVVLTDTDKKFRKGDILKAAGYAAPARNSARGNVLDGGYEINWTGPLYLD